MNGEIKCCKGLPRVDWKSIAKMRQSRREFAVYAEKSDVSEEITRIQSHLKQFHTAIKQKHPIGRKLEFIVQELGREFNTLGSKSAPNQCFQPGD